jgi:sec-independent protein translocase protein TatA
MFGLGVWELLIILVIVLILFGVKRIPQLGSSLGEGIKNFTKSFRQEEGEKKEKPELKDDNDKTSHVS